MPTYEYECQACHHTFEQFQPITANPLRKCPKCGKRRLKRLIGAGAAIIFKGSGFYQTDYRSSEYKSKEKAENARSAGSASESKSKSKSKSDSSQSSKSTDAKD